MEETACVAVTCRGVGPPGLLEPRPDAATSGEGSRATAAPIRGHLPDSDVTRIARPLQPLPPVGPASLLGKANLIFVPTARQAGLIHPADVEYPACLAVDACASSGALSPGVIRLKAHSWGADVTSVTEPSQESSGDAPLKPRSPAAPASRPSLGASLPPEPVDLLLRKYRERVVSAPPAHDPAPTYETPPAESGAAAVPPPQPVGRPPASPPVQSEERLDDPDWTFRPDAEPEPEPGWRYAAYDPALGPDEGQIPRHRPRMAPRVGVIVIVAALIVGTLALTHIGPFRSNGRAATTPTTSVTGATDIRGVWNALDAFSGVLYVATMHIDTQNPTTGAFSGTMTSPVGVETMKGTVSGTAVTFTLTLGSGVEQGSGVVGKSGSKLKIHADFSSPSGARGTIVATRTSR